MKKQILPKTLLGALLFLLSFLSSHAQDAATSNCPNPAGGCDTIGIERKISPWRVGGFLGPAVAFCGSWAGTFNSDKYRDKALFNGIGFNAALNADYFFNPEKKKQLKFGVGAVAGLQNFFFRKDINTFIDKIVAESGSSQAVIRKGSSEDHYFAVGPVLNYAFGKKPRSPFIEASVRGGIFRSTPAAIFIYDKTTGNNIYSVTASDKRYHAGLLATLGFFVPSKNGLWAWGVEAIGFRTKMDYIFPGATVYPFERKHGGFSAGIAMRRSFAKDVPVKKDPTPPLICYAPELELKMGNSSIKGLMFNTSKDTTAAEPIMLTWKSRTTPDTTKTETFTARIHQLNEGMDKVIASVVCQEGNQLAFPAAYLGPNGRPVAGQYYATVHSQQISSCASCVSEASTTGFAVVSVKDSIVPPINPCICLQKVDIFAYKKVTKKIKVWAKSANCENCICPKDKITDISQKIYLHRQENKAEGDQCDETKTIEAILANLTAPKWAKNATISIETTSLGKECKEQGHKKNTYKVKVGKNGKLIFPNKVK